MFLFYICVAGHQVNTNCTGIIKVQGLLLRSQSAPKPTLTPWRYLGSCFIHFSASQPTQHTVRDLELFPNTWLRFEDNVVRASKEGSGVFFTLSDSSPPNPWFSSPYKKRLFPAPCICTARILTQTLQIKVKNSASQIPLAPISVELGNS